MMMSRLAGNNSLRPCEIVTRKCPPNALPIERNRRGFLARHVNTRKCFAPTPDRAYLGTPNPESKAVKKPKKDPIREDRIHNQAIVDAYGPEERAMSWYYHLDDKILFPFQAKCIAPKVISPLRKGDTVEVRGMAPEDACSSDMLVLIRWQARTMAVPLSQLAAIDPDESTAETIGDWHYWVAQGYLF
jgi:hypothetical protein